jgi:hypothetical protein
MVAESKVMKKSVLIVGLPRSMSSLVYQSSRQILSKELKNLDLKIWHDGDPLNHIWTDFPELKGKHGSLDDNDYEKYAAVLDKYKEGHIIKTVAQPYMVKKYFENNPDNYNVIQIKRTLADTVYALHMRNWYWPIKVLGLDPRNKKHCNLTNLCKAVVRMDRELNHIPIKRFLCYENLLWDGGLLTRVYRKLGYRVKPRNHIDQNFVNKRTEVLYCRSMPLYKRIQGIIGKLK